MAGTRHVIILVDGCHKKQEVQFSFCLAAATAIKTARTVTRIIIRERYVIEEGDERDLCGEHG